MKIKILQTFSFLIIVSLFTGAFGQTAATLYPVKRVESAETWRRDGWNAIDSAKKQKFRKGKAKNVILFVGDGMGVSTLTPAEPGAEDQDGQPKMQLARLNEVDVTRELSSNEKLLGRLRSPWDISFPQRSCGG